MPVTRLKGAQRGIAVLACSLLVACAIDSRVGKLEMSESDGSESSAGNTGNAGESPGSPEQSPEQGMGDGEGMEMGAAPLLPLAPGAAGAAESPSGGAPEAPGAQQPGSQQPGSQEPGAAGQGAGGAGNTPGASAPPVASEPEVIGGCFNQLLRNGDFERGSEGWTELSELRDIIVWNGHSELAPTGVSAQAGNYLAWIGGIPSGEFMMYRTRLTQEVAIPAETVSLTFSGYVWASLPEVGLPNPDWAILELADPEPSSSFLWRVMYFEDTQTEGWVRFEQTSTDVARFAGKTVPVQIHNMPNANGLLSVWLDSLRLEARCPR